MAHGLEDRVLNKEQWKLEAESVIKDIKDYVKEVFLSKLESNNQTIFLNVMTIENICHCVQLNSSGFTVVGHAFDENNEKDGPTFETPYALLDHISPNYRTVFANSLISKLNELESKQGDE